MFFKLYIFFQKLKWNILGWLDPYYYVWTNKEKDNEELFRKSGQEHFENFILNDRLLMAKNLFNQSIVLEIGSGVGRITEYLADYFKKVIATDISSAMLNLAKKRLTRFDNISYYVTNGVNLPIKDNSVDFVFSYIVFQHFPTRRLVKENLREIFRVLKPGGSVKIQFRGRPAFGGKLRYFKWYYGVDFNAEKIRSLLERNSFTVVSIKGENTRDLWAIFIKPC